MWLSCNSDLLRGSIKLREIWVRASRWQLANWLGQNLPACLKRDMCFVPNSMPLLTFSNYQLVSLLELEIVMFVFIKLVFISYDIPSMSEITGCSEIGPTLTRATKKKNIPKQKIQLQSSW